MENTLYVAPVADDRDFYYMVATVKGVVVAVYQYGIVTSTNGAVLLEYNHNPSVQKLLITGHNTLCEANYRNNCPLIVLWAGLGDYYKDAQELEANYLWESIQSDKLKDDETVGVIDFGQADNFCPPVVSEEEELDAIWFDALKGDDDEDPTESA